MIRIDFTKKQIIELEYERFHYPCPRAQRKLEVLYLKSQNLNHGMICRLCRISNVTLAKYLHQYIEGGIERLKQNLYKGKENLLIAHAKTLEDYLSKNPPRSSAEVQAIIEEQTGLKRSLTQVREFLKRIGFQYRKAGSIPGKAITAEKIQEQEDFKQKELMPRILEAEQAQREIFLWMPPILSIRHI